MTQLEQLQFHSRRRTLTNANRTFLLHSGQIVFPFAQTDGPLHFHNVPCHLTPDT